MFSKQTGFLLLLLLLTAATTTAAGQESLFGEARGVLENREGEQHELTLEVAATPEARQTGLMFRQELSEDAGMLLVWARPQIVGIWMANTAVALDLLFIDGGGRIVGVHEGAVPFDETVISSGEEVMMVLEVSAGLVSALQLREGDRFRLIP
ncbi:MAG: DUF192 domain-containing protein [Alphaproteobacteria bacterium]|nr:DUF192 domain-containing protein [Alphaproteobacteria bacterium]MDA8004238.1 DUF192 domain-containing protein [Alphaproteobacteria bacterium]MDA8006223.1 DUF192 domain-containing protein [Alphaproteobacteria bacterium]MDA8013436.1 DUF192 domain-containing protein [Alphaproteobacteria bacterium]